MNWGTVTSGAGEMVRVEEAEGMVFISQKDPESGKYEVVFLTLEAAGRLAWLLNTIVEDDARAEEMAATPA